ncbi:MAG: FtsK/SpoIIIE domain-containing protein [Pseudolysinimonas sp.]
MLPPPPIETITVPAAPEPPAPAPFPWLATLAPVAMSLVLFAVTRSPYSLMFAALGPLVAIGSAIDARVSRRRSARRDARRAAEHHAALVERIGAAQQRERERLLQMSGDVAAPAWHGVPGAIPVRVGRGTVASAVRLEGEAPEAVRAAAADSDDGPVVVDARDGIGIVGAPALAAAVARALSVQVAAQLSPVTARLTAAAGADWVAGLPHEVLGPADDSTYRWQWPDGSAVITWAASERELPPGCGARVTAASVSVPCAMTAPEAAAAATELARRAAALGLRPPGSALPERVSLRSLLDEPAPGGPLAAALGRDERGPVIVDLVAEGPHAVVAGTTGSGKSELLVSWALALARHTSPAELSLLLIDFKGGAAFTQLACLPHVVGTLSDLDPRQTRRAIQSLRAELLSRERLLAERGARSIDDLEPGALARLVIIVDEFAAVVASGPDLHEVFADLAARGRSLGLHLILCTQRPAGVVRDAVLANISLRVSLRVTDRGDSVAMVGDDSAARLPADPRGRAILMRDGIARPLQIAIAAVDDAEWVAGHAPPARAPRPWCDPLPADLTLDDVPPVGRGLALGLLDLPHEQRQPPAVYDPEAHGHLLVVGASGAGATTALTTLAVSAGGQELPIEVISADPADAWAQLTALPAKRVMVVIDGVDALLARADPDDRHELLEIVTALLRRGGTGAPIVVVSARRLTGGLAGVAGLFGSRLLLRQSTRDEHLLAGGDHDTFDPGQVPGSGLWRGAVVQVAQTPAGVLPAPRVPAPTRVAVGSDPVLAIVAVRPSEWIARLRGAGVRVVELGGVPVDDSLDADLLHTPASSATVIIGDPDAWQAEWALLTRARREWPIVLLGCAAADHRALLRDRQHPPPLASRPGECWLASGGRAVRAVLEIASGA